MNRRDFVKASVCIGCVGAASAGLPLCKNLKNISPKDIENSIEARKFMYKSTDQLPTKIRLDICNLCQLNCAACWIRKDEEKIKKKGGFGYVSFKTFKDFVDENSFIKEIELSNHGEVFLNPELEDIIKYAYEKNIKLTACNGVNLNTLSDSVAEALVKYKFHDMVVSIDGATPETYAIYRRGGDFNTVINNVKKINKYKKMYNSDYPKMSYKMILFGHNEHEIEKARKLAKELGMYIVFDVNAVPSYSPLKNPDKTLVEAGLKTVESNLDKNLEAYKDGDSEWFFCRELYEKPQFDYNGDMFGCCTPYLETFGVNIFKDGLLKSLNNKKVLYAKLMLSDFSVRPKYNTPCDKCYVYTGLKEKDFPMKVDNLINT